MFSMRREWRANGKIVGEILVPTDGPYKAHEG